LVQPRYDRAWGGHGRRPSSRSRGRRASRGFLETFIEYPPSQEPASFTIDPVARDVERRIKEKAGKK
jgi:hypothetical protein